jgi:hypothetical protein
MLRNRGPPSKCARRGISTHYSLYKQLSLAVLSNHDERYKNRNDNDLRGVQHGLPTLWKTPQRTSPFPLPWLQKDFYRSAQARPGFDVHSPRQGCPGPSAVARRKLHSFNGAHHGFGPQHTHEPFNKGWRSLPLADDFQDSKPPRQRCRSGRNMGLCRQERRPQV